MILLIDNYDSFVYNLARYIQNLGHEQMVYRNDTITLNEIHQINPSHIVISPGPKTPCSSGISMDVIVHFGHYIPILGICLGHQAIGQAYGGQIIRAKRPIHGKTAKIKHNNTILFQGFDNYLQAACYYSLVVSKENLPNDLIITAENQEGEIMALQHRKFPVFGLQFHPESVLTPHGHGFLKNFLKIKTQQTFDIDTKVRFDNFSKDKYVKEDHDIHLLQ